MDLKLFVTISCRPILPLSLSVARALMRRRAHTQFPFPLSSRNHIKFLIKKLFISVWRTLNDNNNNKMRNPIPNQFKCIIRFFFSFLWLRASNALRHRWSRYNYNKQLPQFLIVCGLAHERTAHTRTELYCQTAVVKLKCLLNWTFVQAFNLYAKGEDKVEQNVLCWYMMVSVRGVPTAIFCATKNTFEMNMVQFNSIQYWQSMKPGISSEF